METALAPDACQKLLFHVIDDGADDGTGNAHADHAQHRVGGGDFLPQPPTPPDVRVTYHGGSTKQGFLGSETFRYLEKR